MAGAGENGRLPVSLFGILCERSFLSFFLTQALGAFNDNLFKGAIVILAIYHGPKGQGAAIAMLAGGIFILPYLLFSVFAGELADRFSKSLLIRRLKLLEIVVMMLGAVALLRLDLPMLLVVLFLMGLQSTLFGPVKYAILPELVPPAALTLANGWVEASTFVTILTGTVTGSLLISFPEGERWVSAAVLATAALGYLASRFLPPLPPAAPELRLLRSPLRSFAQVLGTAWSSPELRRTILLISWFWAAGGIYLVQLPAYAREVLGASERVATLLLAMFVFGIGVGSLVAGRFTGTGNRLGAVPWALAGLALSSLDLVGAAVGIEATAARFGVGAFLGMPGSVRLLADLALTAAFGGAAVVPLYAHLQERAGCERRSRVVAANNFLNAVFLVVTAALGAAGGASGLSVPALLFATAACNGMVAALAWLWFSGRHRRLRGERDRPGG